GARSEKNQPLARRGCRNLNPGYGRRGRDESPARLCVSFHAFEVAADVGGVLETKGTVLFQALAEDTFQLCGRVGIQTNRCNGSAVQNGIRDQAGGTTAKRQNAGAHLVEHDAKRKKVSTSVQ